MLPYNKKLKNNSRYLRKNMTEAEQLLWSRVRRKQIKGLQFYRQKIVNNYIVDFYCSRAKLVIELDGGQHYSNEGKKKDCNRDNVLRYYGMKVIRFSDSDIFKNLNEVLEQIWNAV
ncbi:MAG: endonuclease domain-containing protein [Elusimicrobia bacterium]|nr:endonuclease domain-containing protein [Elusimicrobiota bacterium]